MVKCSRHVNRVETKSKNEYNQWIKWKLNQFLTFNLIKKQKKNKQTEKPKLS